MTRDQIIERAGQQAQTYGSAAITYGRRASSIALSKMSGVFDTAKTKTAEYSAQVDPDTSRGKAAKITGAILTGAAIATAAGGSWLMRHNQTRQAAQDGLTEPYGSEPSATPVRDDADRADQLARTGVGSGAPESGPRPPAA